MYACNSCLSAKARCLVPLLTHMGHKRFRAHACLRCGDRGCSLSGTIMSETAAGGVSIESGASAESGVGMVQISSARATRTTTHTLTHTEGDKGGRLLRMQRKVRSRGGTPDTRAKSPAQSRTGSPPPLPTPRHSSPNHTGSSEGAVSVLISSSPTTTSALGSLAGTSSLAERVLATAVDGLVSPLQKHELKHKLEEKNGSAAHASDDLGPPPARPTLAAFTSNIHIVKRRRVSSLALGPGLSIASALPSTEAYRAALVSSRSEMHAAESAHESAVALLAEAQHACALAADAEARVHASLVRIDEEREAALAHAAACAAAMEELRADVAAKTRAREDAAASVAGAQERVVTVAAELEACFEAYDRVVRGFIL
ncbi:hypothetical protein CC85DRAFT_40940 [Cutaneotrichosporon oleaginosum]|uniref:Uncharacterized protein n=1 Tax=Cutaneotrichosporon oleaginosum TaxID=879819 RepID=A0A0J0XS42_9TREE|nr:uncharacterized protein CC85DRAFT_40940 [Cutaneotrichosporon oleaginosum]KLT43891.1 hypothetical protein CC85DRAFT_40940 [Cutaneotrichosporon oleaginosum]TXT06369.1 hypothetical protein COLE_05700 [Cutaneotrichosporon oleaginosum]